MYFIRTEEPVDGLARISFTHYSPSMLTDDDMKDGILIEPFEIDEIDGKISIAYYDVEAKKVVIKHEDRPKKQEDILRETVDALTVDNLNMQAKLDATQSALEQLIIENLSQGGIN